jgi:hypothetical protein
LFFFQNLCFILRLRNKIFRIKILHGYSVYSWLYQYTFSNFFIALIFEFDYI